MNLNENLRQYREQAGYTIQKFADMVNIPYGTYASYENQGKIPRLEKLIRIADILNVSLDDLVGRKSKKSNNKDQQLEQIIKTTISAINENNGPFTIQLLKIDPNYIRVAFENDDLVSEGEDYARGISISKKDVIESINTINLETDNTRRILLFERLATLTLDKAQYHCESTSSVLNDNIKNWSYDNVIDGVTGKPISQKEIEKGLKKIKQSIEHFKKEQEQIFKYRKALQDFMSSK